MSKEKQIEETYELIMKAFLTLLNNKPFDEITLTEIASNAGVARMTLYRHFKTKEDILIYRADKKVKKLKSVWKNKPITTEEFINSFFVFYKDLPLRHLIPTDENINAIFRPYIIELRKELNLHLKECNFAKLDDYTYNFLIGGINEIIFIWCKNNFREDSMYLTDKIMLFINNLK